MAAEDQRGKNVILYTLSQVETIHLTQWKRTQGRQKPVRGHITNMSTNWTYSSMQDPSQMLQRVWRMNDLIKKKNNSKQS